MMLFVSFDGANIAFIFETSFLLSCFSSLLFNKCVLIWLFSTKKLYLCGVFTIAQVTVFTSEFRGLQGTP